MATTQEAKLVEIIRKAREDNDDFNLAFQLDSLYNSTEESSFRALLDDIGIGYRTGRYLVGIIEDADRLSYPYEDVQTLMQGIGWTKSAIILRSLTRRRSISNLIKKYRSTTVAALRNEFPSPAAKRDHASKRQFAAFLTEQRYKKLIRYLEKNHSLPKTKGKRKDVSKAFSALIDDL